MPGFLAAFDIAPGGERLYRRILRHTPVSPPDLAAELGWDEAMVRRTAAQLVESGLVTETRDGMLEAEDPRAAVGRLVEGALADVRRREAELHRTRGSIAHFTNDFQDKGRPGRRPTWEVVPTELVAGVALESIQTTTGPIRSSAVTAEWSPEGLEQLIGLTRDTVRSGRSKRSLYPVSALASASSRRWIARFAAAGEEQRLIAEPLSEFAILGTDMVLATAEWGALDVDYVKIRDPMLVQAFTHLFDLAWAQGIVPPDQATDGADERRLLTLLAAGHKDEAIARHLGVSLRTVRRRLALLMDDHGVATRFQLGMAVAGRDLSRPAAGGGGGQGGGIRGAQRGPVRT
ncbi:helix-turn-helix domain-containing protein [Arsenicicoccus sp. oral taxon 190]|uniref:helix-turn-helix domain-containing protein n=1 Tax=Arsenicicoccus sp. oral taxon 190 TaxID=1658671 RepID=UPI000679F980|nr:helix-turn-helix domain-containing protein [Arsenicicoccus sp. oral taxon 190]AKT50363.1 hypothetical protein ADJ73_01775 [Arsenicicoccus sp. oral taxon 190]